MAEPTAEQKVLSLTIAEYEQIQPIVTVKHDGGGDDIVFFTPNSKALWRAQTVMSKEPETLDWISTFQPGDVLVDVGANVGIYTIWAAKTRSARVFAFEPESQNYALLNRNIFLNGLSGTVSAYCVALSDERKFDRLHLSAVEAAGSCHSFGDEVDFNLRPARFQQTQGCFCTSLDRLIAEGVLPPPNHIKIDVDGIEHKVLAGAANAIRHENLRSILVEINTNLHEHLAIIDDLTRLGYHYSQEEVEKNRVQEGPFAGVANFVFRRPAQTRISVAPMIQPLRA